MDQLIRIQEITKTYPIGGLFQRKQRLFALQDINLEIQRGEILGILGESGSGKSTLARILARLEVADSGHFSLDGNRLFGRPKSKLERLAYGARVQMIFQDPFSSLNPAHTIGYQLSRPLILHGKTRSTADLEKEAATLLDDVGMRPGKQFLSKYPFELSGGQRQRVAIARALAVQPDLLIADEPTSMLDVSNRMDILNLLKKIRETRNLTIVMITHDLPSAWYLTDRIAVIFSGQIVEAGLTEEILAKPSHPYTNLLLEVAKKRLIRTPSRTKDDGSLKSQLRQQAGCTFAARCPRASSICTSEAPLLRPLADERTIRCHTPLHIDH
ncbi:MAG: ABC transporter ATP-binding protein [Oligoflexus sp.]